LKVRNRLRRGATTLEVLTAASISTLVLFGAILAFLSGMGSWAKGSGRIASETRSQSAIRAISQQLREAMSVTVDEDGLGLNYRFPKVDGDGNYIVPAEWDGIERRIEYKSGAIQIIVEGNKHIVCTGVTLSDPLRDPNDDKYKIFTKGPGAITRQVTVQIVSQHTGKMDGYERARIRETIYLRNIPAITR